jgi:hypothetical protein
MADRGDVARAVAVTAEFFGKELSQAAVDVLMEDLAEYNPDAVLAALRACRKELSRFPAPADIIGRMASRDGRPGAAEAWAMIPQDESGSVVWTDEMQTAFGVAGPLMRDGQEFAARKAFEEIYEREVRDAREQRRPPRWMLSRGTSKAGVKAAIETAIAKGRLDQGALEHFLPDESHASKCALIGVTPPVKPEDTQKFLEEIRSKISKSMTVPR